MNTLIKSNFPKVPRIRTNRESPRVLTKLKEFISILQGFRDVYDGFRDVWTFLNSQKFIREVENFPLCGKSRTSHEFREECNFLNSQKFIREEENLPLYGKSRTSRTEVASFWFKLCEIGCSS